MFVTELLYSTINCFITKIWQEKTLLMYCSPGWDRSWYILFCFSVPARHILIVLITSGYTHLYLARLSPIIINCCKKKLLIPFIVDPLYPNPSFQPLFLILCFTSQSRKKWEMGNSILFDQNWRTLRSEYRPSRLTVISR